LPRMIPVRHCGTQGVWALLVGSAVQVFIEVKSCDCFSRQTGSCQGHHNHAL